MPQRLTKSSIYSRSLHLLDLQLVLLWRDKNKVCLLCEEILKQIPAFDFFCASLESISAIEDTWERWEVWEDIQVVPGFLLGRERWLYGCSANKDMNQHQFSALSTFTTAQAMGSVSCANGACVVAVVGPLCSRLCSACSKTRMGRLTSVLVGE
ncbi:hypothetical protein Tco_0852451 [Tanacetum coccineum]